MNDQPASPEMRLAPAADKAREPLHPTAAPPAPTAALPASPWLGIGIRLFILLLVSGLIALVTLEWDWWVGSAIRQTTDDAYLEADMTPLAAKVPGYVRRVLVQDFQRVKAGDLVVEIVDDDYRAQLHQARANVAGAKAAIAPATLALA